MVRVNGRPAPPVTVAGDPRLYAVATAATDSSQPVELDSPPGLTAYSFTFG